MLLKMHAVLNSNLFKLCYMHNERVMLKEKKFISYLHQPGKHPLMYKTIGQILDDAADKFGDKPAIVSGAQRKILTFSQVKEQADLVASAIYGLGGKVGDRVGIWAGNSVEWYVTSFAIAKAGLVSVYLNPAYLSNELEYCLNAVGVKILFTTDKFRNQQYLPILEKVVPEIMKSKDDDLNCERVPSLKSIISFKDLELPAVIPFSQLHERTSKKCKLILKETESHISPDEISNIQFTSGTTGAAKGATLTHFGIINNAFICAKRLNLNTKKDHSVCFMGPLFHALGSVVGVLSALLEGLPLVLPDEAFSPTKAVDSILNEKCTVLIGTPTMYVDVIKILKERKLKTTTPEVAISGGAYATPSLFSDMLNILGLKRVASVYGLTETGPINFMSQHDDTKEQQLRTVGCLLDYVEVKVVNEKGEVLPLGSAGELWVRNFGVTRGYYNNVEKTREAITESGWFKTGDQFTISKDGYGRIVGRIKDMIIRGGENIYPADIETVLSTHKSIQAVEVVGVPDKRLGEHVCACIILLPNAKLTEEEVKSFCKDKMAPFKVPHYVIFMEEFPRTTSGKVQKFVLRKEAMKTLGIEEL